jgi:hypothetical protein
MEWSVDAAAADDDDDTGKGSMSSSGKMPQFPSSRQIYIFDFKLKLLDVLRISCIDVSTNQSMGALRK